MYLLSRLVTPSLRSSRPILAFSNRCSPIARTYCSSPMSGAAHNAAGGGGPAEQKKTRKDDGMKELRILMLHGYTQSGPLFRSKTRALEKSLAKALAPSHLKPVLFYPTAPNPLSAKDIPGYQPAEGEDEDDNTTTDAWAWFRKDVATGTYRLLPEGMHHLARYIAAETAGRGVHGVIGFSQGGFVAATVAAVLERPPNARIPPAGEDEGWVAALREANGGKGLRFAVVYSGFYAPQGEMEWLYRAGKEGKGEGVMVTPTMHFLGGLDTVVEEGRSRGLVERCVGGVGAVGREGSAEGDGERVVVVVHPGGHYVPVAKEWVAPLVGFVRKYADGVAEEQEESQERASI